MIAATPSLVDVILRRLESDAENAPADGGAAVAEAVEIVENTIAAEATEAAEAGESAERKTSAESAEPTEVRI